MKWLNVVIVTLFFIFLFALNLHTSIDFNQDLGRHLALGKIIWQTKQIPHTNLFSYTNPTFPFINHHWLFEVFAYLITSFFGISALLWMKVLLILVSVGIVVKLSAKQAGIFATIVAATIVSPLFLERSDIRPELFGYLFFSIILYVLLSDFKTRHSSEMILPYPYLLPTNYYLLPLIMLLFVNTHVTFVFGAFLIFLIFLKFRFYLKLRLPRANASSEPKSAEAKNKFASRSLITKEFRGGGLKIENLKFFTPFILSFFVLFINPNGVSGVLYPFRIFQNYGYSIAENQNIFFLSSISHNPIIKYFFLLTPLFVLTIIALLLTKKWVKTILFVVFLILAVCQIRHLSFFGLIGIPIIAYAISAFLNHRTIHFTQHRHIVATLSTAAILLGMTLIFFNNVYFQTFDINKSFGLGFAIDAQRAADYITSHKLPKNIFNNFDVGGYMIYRLYPTYRLFIDNRPEAYPAEFFQNTYIPMQENRQIREAVFKKYDINTIVFAYTDQTPWGQTFFKDILNDLEWHLVYADSSVIVLTRDGQDIRGNDAYFQTQIDQEKNYLRLIYLSQLCELLRKPTLSNREFEKASLINPHSCALRRANYQEMSTNPLLFYQAESLKQSAWWCF